ncbi:MULTISPECIES: tryptophan-rich sensory protein [unclassified Psychrobacter]|uniref:tryptophan-rich sensory protein n=1 Tax=unclassified Psychrobacter TaxID=196806 RepID=UPI003FB94D94
MIESNYKKVTVWTVVNLLVLFATLAVNYLGSSGFFNGMGQAAVSEKYKTLLTPNGFAFSIWGVIYTLIFATLVTLFLKRKDPAVTKIIARISGLFVISSLFNMAWIVAFSYERVGLSTIFIVGILVSLMTIVHRTYNARVGMVSTLAGTAFTLYASWVFVATILNNAIFLVQQGVDGFGISSSVWTIVVLIFIVAVVVGYVMRYRNAVFPIAVAWAYFGIHSSYANGLIAPSMAWIIQLVLLFGIAVLIALSCYTFVKNSYSIFPPTKA